MVTSRIPELNFSVKLSRTNYKLQKKVPQVIHQTNKQRQCEISEFERERGEGGREKEKDQSK
jgi:mannosyltransferase OCH1-like enzyme